VAVQLTVALCTYNPRHDLIARAIHAVVSQLDDVDSSTEFVIVDNNSKPPLQDADFLRGLPLLLIREPVPGLTAARAAAVRRASGRIILFVDDDNILGPGYLRGVITAFDDPALGVLGGSVVPEYESAPPSWLAAFEAQLAIRRYPAALLVETTGLPFTGYFPVGAGFAVLRSVALTHLADGDTHGRIEGRKGGALSSGEDLDLDLFALSTGYKLKVTGSLCLTHVIPAERTTEEYISRLVVSNVRSTEEVDKKWSVRFGVPIFGFLHRSRLDAALRCLLFRVLSPVSVRSRIKRKLWDEIRRARTHSA
jgi:glycosyltransferase involved in cell wall biosynthesis